MDGMRRYDITQSEDEIKCPHCGKSNSRKAYCCIHCFKEMRPKIKLGFWDVYIRPRMSFYLVMFLMVGGFIVYIRGWIENVESEVTLNLTTADHMVSNSAEMARRRSLLSVSEKSPIPSEEIPQ